MSTRPGQPAGATDHERMETRSMTARSRPQAPGATDPVTRCRSELSRNEKGRDEPPFGGLQKDFAMWKRDDKGNTLYPTVQANQHQNAKRQALHTLACQWIGNFVVTKRARAVVTGPFPSIQWSPWNHHQRRWHWNTPKRRRRYNQPTSQLECKLHKLQAMQIHPVHSPARTCISRPRKCLGA
jgi:hypothetical protein